MPAFLRMLLEQDLLEVTTLAFIRLAASRRESTSNHGRVRHAFDISICFHFSYGGVPFE
ncbi:hypothetical protein [Burkholderia sp. ABCPW 14]|uniref:hypothetical protein n=1 Tax=Burkholderia sp. ABCPW 14 TaxID=1637860 RepID=UPI000AF8C6F7|nr:hypothetical protein [Burkholderia sp. ABCPW 14]